MILIADSGATKTDWACISLENDFRTDFSSQGYNPNYITGPQIIEDIIKSAPDGFPFDDVTDIYFYGAGVTELQYPFMTETFGQVFKNSSVFVSMDLLAAARSLLGSREGFAAILGTGTNSCLYDGRKIIHNVDSLGFILGDEGSGAYLGKKMLVDFVRGKMPENVSRLIAGEVKMNGDEIIDRIYTKPFPNRFCAGFSKFIGHHVETFPYFRNLVTDAFRAFFSEIVCHYPDYKNYTFNCVGSVAFYYKDLLSLVAEENGMKTGIINKSPLDGLVKFHKSESGNEKR